jgi:hypothetical protein
MFGDSFVKIFKFLRIYILSIKFWRYLRKNNFIMLYLGELFLEKMEISKSFFGKNHGKLAHLRNLAAKIIYVFRCPSHQLYCGQCPLGGSSLQDKQNKFQMDLSFFK